MRGIDVSNLQGPIDWNAVRKSGIAFAYIKATEGATYQDALFHTNVAAARAAGLKVGAYHFARPDRNQAAAEARNFLSFVGVHLDLNPVLDWEQKAPQSPSVLGDWLAGWLQSVEGATGKKAVVYTYPAYWKDQMGDTRHFADRLLWLASYGPNDGRKHGATPVGGWKQINMLQFTSNGVVPGVRGHVDLSDVDDLTPFLSQVQTPRPKPGPALTGKLPAAPSFWTWLAWKTGTGVFDGFGSGNPNVRPSLPPRVPTRWMSSLKWWLAHRRLARASN